MVGPKKQDFWPKINMLKGNRCILRIRGAPVRQKLGMILENKVVQKLKLEKNVFYKKLSPKLIILNDFFLKTFRRFLTLKIDFESTILALFDKLVLPVFSKYNDFL